MKTIKAMLYEEHRNADGSILMKPITNARTVTASVAASILNVSRFTIYRLIGSGALPAERLTATRCLRIDVENLEKYRREKQEC